MGGPLNGSRDQMRKEADKERVIDQGLSRFQPFEIDVNNISEGLKGVERDSGRQKNPEQRDVDWKSGGGERT